MSTYRKIFTNFIANFDIHSLFFNKTAKQPFVRVRKTFMLQRFGFVLKKMFCSNRKQVPWLSLFEEFCYLEALPYTCTVFT